MNPKERLWLGIVLIAIAGLLWVNIVALFPVVPASITYSSITSQTTGICGQIGSPIQCPPPSTPTAGTPIATYTTTYTNTNTFFWNVAPGFGCWQSGPGSGQTATWIQEQCGTAAGPMSWWVGQLTVTGFGSSSYELLVGATTYALDFSRSTSGLPLPTDSGKTITVIGSIPFMSCPATTATTVSCSAPIVVYSWFYGTPSANQGVSGLAFQQIVSIFLLLSGVFVIYRRDAKSIL